MTSHSVIALDDSPEMSELLAALKDHRACDLAILDQKIETKDFISVYQFLAKFSILWFNIGLCIGVPIERLHEIDLDYHTTIRKLAEMINAWINNCKNCTWRVLIEALQHGGNIKSKNSNQDTIVFQEPKTGAWDEKAAMVSSHEAGYFILQSFTKKSYENYMGSLRDLLKVRNAVSDESLLCNIDLYIFISDAGFVVNFFMHTNDISEIAKSFRYNKKFLKIWANFVILETNSVCDKLHTLAVDKEKIKETLFKKEAERQKHYESNSYEIQLFSEMTRSKDQAGDIKRNMEDADNYRESLCHSLNSCLDNVHVALNHNNKIKFAASSMKTSIKCLAFTFGLIFLPILHLTLWTEMSATFGIGFAVACVAILIEACLSKLMMRNITGYVLNTIHKHFIAVGTLAGAFTGFLYYLMPLIPNHQQPQSILKNRVRSDSEPWLQQAQSILDSHQVMALVETIRQDVFFMQYDFSGTVMTWIVCGIVISVIHSSNWSIRAMGILCCISIIIYLEAKLVTKVFLLLFCIVSVVANSKGFTKFLMAGILGNLIICLCAITVDLGLFTGQFFGAYAGYLGPLVGASLGGGIAALCLLGFASSVKIPIMDNYMIEPIQCFDETVKDLKLIEEGINSALIKAQASKQSIVQHASTTE